MSRFLEPRHFASNAPYRLLPFRFSPLNDAGDYVLTNMVGEFVVTNRGVLDRLVAGALVSDSEEYSELKAKHFLWLDESEPALELLALKTRTKFQNLANFTALHIFVVSLRCEHSCPYCQVSRQSDDRVAFDMTEEIAERALALVFRSPSPALKIEFQGGEPLLNFPLVKYVVRRAKELNTLRKADLQFVIASNLAVLTDEVLAFCRDEGVLLSTSLDGPADLHNKNRPRPGRDSHARAIEGIYKAREALGPDGVSALMTTTAASLTRTKEIVDEYVSHGFRSLFFRPLSPYGFAVKTKTFGAYNSSAWLEAYFGVLDYIIELNKGGTPFVELYAATILKKMLTPFEPGYVDLMSPAGIGIGAVVYNYDGDVYASDEGRMLAEMGDKRLRLGNVRANSYDEIFLSSALLDPLEASFAGSAPMCSECAFEPYCGADPVYHLATQDDYVGKKPLSDFCHRNMSIFKRLFELMRKDAETRTLFWQWAYQGT